MGWVFHIPRDRLDDAITRALSAHDHDLAHALQAFVPLSNQPIRAAVKRRPLTVQEAMR